MYSGSYKGTGDKEKSLVEVEQLRNYIALEQLR